MISFGVSGTAAFLVLSGLLGNGFTYDDLDRIQMLSLHGTLTQGMMHGGRGLTYLTQAMDLQLWGVSSVGFHLTTLLLHSIVTGLVALVALELTRSRACAMLTGLLFAVHPVHVEAVASFVNRKDVLALAFGLGAILFWIRSRSSRWKYLAALACLGLGLYAKEADVVSLPVILLMLDLAWPQLPGCERIPLRIVLTRAMPFFALGLIAVLLFGGDLRQCFTGSWIHANLGGPLQNYGDVFANSAASVIRVVRLLAWPAVLSADYSQVAQSSALVASAALGTLVVILAVAAVPLSARVSPGIAFGLAWTIILYLPSSNLLPLTEHFAAERYLYGPSVGICLAIASALDQLGRRSSRSHRSRYIAGVTAVLLVALGATRSAMRARDWRDEESLWRSSLSQGVVTLRAHHNLGAELWRQDRYAEAVPQLAQAVRMAPEFVKPRRLLAASLLATGAFVDAEREGEGILRLVPEDADAQFVVGEALLAQGDTTHAGSRYSAALARDSTHVGALLRLGEVLLNTQGGSANSASIAAGLAERALWLTQGTDLDYEARAHRLLRDIRERMPGVAHVH